MATTTIKEERLPFGSGVIIIDWFSPDADSIADIVKEKILGIAREYNASGRCGCRWIAFSYRCFSDEVVRVNISAVSSILDSLVRRFEAIATDSEENKKIDVVSV